MPRPTHEQLVAALLDAVDLGPDFEVSGALPTFDDDQPVSVMGLYNRKDPPLRLLIGLVDAVSGSPRQMAEATLYWTRIHQEIDDPDRVVVHEMPPPNVGEDGVCLRTEYVNRNDRHDGDVVGWRHGAVIVQVSVTGPDLPDAAPFVEMQHAKAERAGYWHVGGS